MPHVDPHGAAWAGPATSSPHDAEASAHVANGAYWSHPEIVRHARLVGVLNKCRRTVSTLCAQRDQEKTVFQCALRAAGVRIQHVRDDLDRLREEARGSEALNQGISDALKRERAEIEHNDVAFAQEVRDLRDQAGVVEEQVTRARNALKAAQSRVDEEAAWVDVELKPNCMKVEQEITERQKETSTVKRDLETIHGHRTSGLREMDKDLRTTEERVQTVRAAYEDMNALHADIERGLIVARKRVVRALPFLHDLRGHFEGLTAALTAAEERGRGWQPVPLDPHDPFTDTRVEEYLRYDDASYVSPQRRGGASAGGSPPTAVARSASPTASGSPRRAAGPSSPPRHVQFAQSVPAEPTNRVFAAALGATEDALRALQRVEARAERVMAERAEIERLFHEEASVAGELHMAAAENTRCQQEIHKLRAELAALKQRVNGGAALAHRSPGAHTSAALLQRALHTAQQLKDEIAAVRDEVTHVKHDKRALQRSIEKEERERGGREAELAALRQRLADPGAAPGGARYVADLPHGTLNHHEASLIERLHLDAQHGVQMPRNMSPGRREKVRRHL